MSKMNRYARKKKHKRELEKHYANKYGSYSNVRLLRERLEREANEYKDSYWGRKHPARNKGWEYWRIWYLTGPRQYAKKYTDKRIRQKYRQMIRKFDPDDVNALHGADYEKEFDYTYTIW